MSSRISQISAHLKSQPEFSRPLRDCVCILTGCNSALGIGRATAWLCARNGALAIYVTDIEDADLESLAAEIRMAYPKTACVSQKVDAANEEDIKGIISLAVQQFSRLDFFFANAAIKHAPSAMKLTNASKSKSGGSIVATASVAGLRFGAGGPDYSASKAAVINLCQTGACSLTGTDIRVNAVCPGLTETGMTAPVFDGARRRGTENKIGQLNPLQRAASAEDIAEVVVFLGGSLSGYINGQAVAVDGGLSGL
ncbi:hypothetical protein HK096_001517 [Nowakowskiella sp. JEL0078]|nr:hypothetical protein HK096_001517 [Nowakowskiella sp. JEL0078]